MPAGVGPSVVRTAMTSDQSRETARTHFRQLRAWLNEDGGLANATQRTHARDKLTRLTRQQFMELSTDVYDELMRRLSDSAADQPFLPVRQEFHPKRNQARQKLATLPLQRYRDLASDVYFELERRYPEFLEDEFASEPPRPAPAPPTAAGGALSDIPERAISPSYAREPPSATSRNMPTSATTANDMIVPNKSTLVVENSQSGLSSTSSGHLPYDDRSRPSLDRERRDKFEEYEREDAVGASPGAQSRATRASETSSVGTRFIGGYAGSAPHSEAGGVDRSWEMDERERLKADYEYKITMLGDRIRELERENEDAREHLKTRGSTEQRIRDLEAQVRSHRDHADNLTHNLSTLRLEHDSLQKSSRAQASSSNELSRMSQELQEAKDLANELRGEVSSLAEELRHVSSRYEAALGDLEQERKQRNDVEEELRSWRRKYEGAKTELRNMKATSQLFSSDIRVENDHLPASPEGVIADVNLTAFQTAVDDLLQAARSKEPSTVISGARAVVAAVGKIDADVSAGDRAILSMREADQERLQTLKSNTHATLSNLVTAARNHATSFGYSPVSLVDAAASHVSASIVELVKLLKVKKTDSFKRDTASTTGGRLPPIPTSSSNHSISSVGRSNGVGSSGPPPAASSRNERAMSPIPDRSSVQSAYSSHARQPSYGHQSRPSEDRNQYGSYQSPTSNYGYSQAGQSQGYGAPHYQDAYHQENTNGGLQPGLPYDDGQERDEYHDDNGDGAYSQDREQLRAYLESQTEAIVHSIQSLLSAIRSGAQSAQLNENLTSIITIVSSIVAITKDALTDETRYEGEQILHELESNCDKLSEMQSASTFNKATKQSMATASFGVAKSLKALNALFEAAEGGGGGNGADQANDERQDSLM